MGCSARARPGAWLMVLAAWALFSGCLPIASRTFHTREEPDPIRGERGGRRTLQDVATELERVSLHGLEGDGRLADIAEELVTTASDEAEALDGTALALLARARGLVNPLPQVVYARGPDIRQAGESLLKRGAAWAVEFESTHYGLAAKRRGRSWVAVLVLDTRPVELAPLPVFLAHPGTVEIDARLRGYLVEPTLVITQPDGTVEKPATEPLSRHLHQKMLLTKGLWGIEVVATGPHGPMVVANVAVAVGVPVPSEPPHRRSVPRSAAEMANELARLIAEDRRIHGLSPLAHEGGLAQVAAEHSRDMRDHHFFGHVSERSGGPQDRVAGARVSAWNLRENVARGYTAREIHTLLMLSPAHRAALLSPHVDRVGIGVAIEREGKRPAFYVTELFAHAPVAIDREAAARELFARVSALRAARKLPPLVRAKSLDAAARLAADGYLAHPDTDGEIVLRAAVNSITEPPDTKVVLASLYLDVEAAALPLATELLDRQSRFLGIAIAQGDDPRLGPNGVVWAVVVSK